MNNPPSLHGPGRYEIRVQGRIDALWAASFDGLTLASDGSGTTVVAGWFADQSALHGTLEALRDLGLPLISVIPTDDTPQH
ncbi:MAG: hypothetical protein ABUL56_00465 [Actinomycetota bacterium]